MSRIRSKDTDPELTLRRKLWHTGARYRKGYRIGRARVDIGFVGAGLAVFVDGCFWHGCPDHYVRPRSRPAFWSQKLEENVRRDQRQTRELEDDGWKVLRVWEHQVYTDLEAMVERIRDLVGQTGPRDPDRPHWQVMRADPAEGNSVEEIRVHTELRGLQPDMVVRRRRTTEKW